MKLITATVRDDCMEDATYTHAEALGELPDTLWGAPTLQHNNLDAEAAFDLEIDRFSFPVTNAIHQTILQAFP